MNTYYFIFEVVPQLENPVIAHVSRAVVHFWVLAEELNGAREQALAHLESERWNIDEEKDGHLLTPEHLENLQGEELANCQAAQRDGLKAKFYYWHRTE